jgi:hypothetical protein
MNSVRLPGVLLLTIALTLLGHAGLANAVAFTNIGCALNAAATANTGCADGQATAAGDSLTLTASRSIVGGYTDNYTFTATAPAAQGSVFAFNFGASPNQQISDLKVTLNGTEYYVPGVGSGTTTFTALLINGVNTLSILAVPQGSGAFANSAGYSLTLTAVPLPAAAWLFISALGGLALIGRKRRMLAANV